MKTLAVFTSSVCMPCRLQKKEIEAFIGSHPELRLKLLGVDTAEGSAEAVRCEVSAVPTLCLLNEDGSVAAKHVGLMKAADIEAFVKRE